MKIREICGSIEKAAPLGLAYPWDRVGLQIGDPDADVSTVLVTLTVAEEAIAKAVKNGAGLIVSHHPIIWEPLTTLCPDNPDARLCMELLRANLASYAAHTNLDIAPGGVNAVLAQRLGLVDTRPLLPAGHAAAQVKLVTFVPETHLEQVRQAVCEAGAGVIGAYSFCSFSAPGIGTFLPAESATPFSGRRGRVNEEPELRFETLVPKPLLGRVLEALHRAHPYEAVAYDIVAIENTDPGTGIGLRGRLPEPRGLAQFAAMVRDVLGAFALRVVGPARKRIEHVGVLGGAGGSHIADMPDGLDALVTGDVGYHDALQGRRRGLAVLDAGHAATEKWCVPALAEHLRKNGKGLRVLTHMESELFWIPPS